MRLWETFRVFAVMVMALVAVGFLGFEPLKRHLQPQMSEPPQRIDPAEVSVPPPDDRLLVFAARIGAKDWRRLQWTDRATIEIFEDTSSDLAENLDAWVEAAPNSAKARMARGMYWRNVGWATRGGRFWNDTHRWQKGGMRDAFNKAVEDFEAAAEMASDWAAPHAILVEIYMAWGERRLMEEAFRSGISADPTDPLPYRYRLHAASPWWSAKTRADARATRKAILEELGPVETRHENLRYLDGYLPLLEGEIARRDDRPRAALKHLKSATEHGAFFEWAYAYRLAKTGRFADAAPHFRDAIFARPFGAEKYAEYGWVLRSLELDGPARQALDYALALDPFCQYCNRQAGYLAESERRYEDALKHYERALVYGGHVASNWNAIGYFRLYKLKDPARAATDYATAAKLNPDWPRYRYFRALALDKSLNCMAVPAYREYLAMCDGGSRCNRENADWAEFAWRDLVDRQLCDESGVHVKR